MILAISRAERYSPNSIDKDAAILHSLCKELKHYGYDVDSTDEISLGANDNRRVYISMARTDQALDLLDHATRRGAIVMNDPHAVVLCKNRRLLMKTLANAGLNTPAAAPAPAAAAPAAAPAASASAPKTPSNSASAPQAPSGYWVKKNRGYSEQAADVCYAADGDQLTTIVAQMKARGIDDIYVTPHVEGDLVKFYGVAGTDFFRTFYPGDDRQFKFAQEEINGLPQHYSFDAESLQRSIDTAARHIGLDFYGGDAIIAPDGTATIIDFNDWPSYSRCREEAARAMALAVAGRIRQKGKRPLLPLGSHAGVRAIIFDYGGTLDTGGTHWGKQLWHAYQRQQVPVSEELFREAYVHAERTLGKNPIIKPEFTFFRTLETKVEIELKYIEERIDGFNASQWLRPVVDDLYALTLSHTRRSRQVLTKLAQKMPMVLVSNFYGNVATVLREMQLDTLFTSVIESAVVGVRKPDPRIFSLGVEALGIKPSETVVIGDSYDKDIEPAKAAGCRTVWYIGEGWNDGLPDATHADAVITSLTELE